MRRIHLMFAALVVAAAMAVSACGGSSGASSSGASGTTSGSGSNLGGGSALSDGNFCGVVKRYDNNNALNRNASSIADYKQRAQVLKTAFDQLVAAAPSQIKSDTQTLRAAFNEFDAAVMNANSLQDLDNTMATLQSSIESNPANQAAVNNIDAYTKQHCGVTFS